MTDLTAAASNDNDGHTSFVDEESGLTMEWDEDRHAYFPQINDIMFENYHKQYTTFTGQVGDDWEEQRTPDGKIYYFNKETQKTQWNNPRPPVKEDKKKAEKRKASEKTFFALADDKNPNIYVSCLPLDISEAEFEEILCRFGLINEDQDGNKKFKLYRDTNGDIKGDGRCCYLKQGSVDLALQLLDGMELRGHMVSCYTHTISQYT